MRQSEWDWWELRGVGLPYEIPNGLAATCTGLGICLIFEYFEYPSSREGSREMRQLEQN